MIDNFVTINKLLVFENPDHFYHLQIIKRKKEHPELGSNSKIIKTYYIGSLEYLEEKREEIIMLCNLGNSRAYINLNRRSYEQCAFQTLRKVTDIIMSKDFNAVRKAYESVCGAHNCEDSLNKRWIIDVDIEPATHITDINHVKFVDSVVEYINLIRPLDSGNKYLATIPTKNGYHLITKPFDVQQFNNAYRLDVHKDNPTVLYTP